MSLAEERPLSYQEMVTIAQSYQKHILSGCSLKLQYDMFAIISLSTESKLTPDLPTPGCEVAPAKPSPESQCDVSVSLLGAGQ